MTLRSSDEIGLIQLIFPSTQLFDHTEIGKWNVDKRRPDAGKDNARCLFGTSGRITYRECKYYNSYQRHVSPRVAWIVDVPREIKPRDGFEPAGTKFANYVVDLSSGKLFDDGVMWGYRVEPRSGSFRISLVSPTSVRFSRTNEHEQAISRFLKLR